MLKKSMKIIAVLLLIMTVVALTASVFATESSSAVYGWNTYETNIKAEDPTGASNVVGKMANAILSVAQVVGMAVAVIMLIVLAIKYISAAPSDKAEIKKHAVVYVVGAVVLFGATGIMQIIKNFAAITTTAQN